MLAHKLAIAALAIVAGTGLSPQPAGDITVIAGGFEPGHQPDGNSVVFAAPEGLVVLDTGRHPAHAQKILDFAARTKQPIVAVVNTHWHLDHVSGNPRLRASYPALKVHASNAIDGAMHGFLADSRKQATAFLAQGDVPEAMRDEIQADMATIDSGKAVYPDVIIDHAGERVLAGRKFQVGLDHAATRGDVWLYDPTRRYLASGDLVTLPVPFLDTGCATKWSAALARLDALGFERAAPGHGPVLDHDQFHAYRQAFDGFVQCAAGDSPETDCAAGWVRDAGTLIDESDRTRVDGMLGYYVGVVRDQARQAKLCAD